MKNFDVQNGTAELGLTVAVDVYDHAELFRTLDNDAVLQLSRLGGAAGFSGTQAILRSTGIARRRVLQPGVSPVDLAVAVCRRLQLVSQVPFSDFDHILLCHSSTDHLACEHLADEMSALLGLAPGQVQAFNHGCSGFLKLMTEASLLLEGCAVGSRVALISVETPEFWHDAADRLFCGIVSAGATGCVMEVGRGLSLPVIRSDDFHIPAERRPNPDPLFAVETGDVYDFSGNPCHRQVMRMNAEPVFLNGIELMLDNLRTALSSIDVAAGERVIVAPHQPSGKLLKALVAVAKHEFPDAEFLNNLPEFGNTISSSVPTLISQLDQVLHANDLAPLRTGDHLILLAAGICMHEISNHMSAGHACLRWKNEVLNQRPQHVPQAVAESASR